MNAFSARGSHTSFSTLRNLVRRPRETERCELCGAGLAEDHRHLVDPPARRLVCVCDACAMLFRESAGEKYKRVPRRARRLETFQITDVQWDGLLIPIGLAFFLESSVDNRMVAFYPSPAGTTESMLPLESWNEIVEANPILREMQADVEALLVNRVDRSHSYYLTPIDKCYELVGRIRSHWRGLSGGTLVWEEIRRFFEALQETAEAANA